MLQLYNVAGDSRVSCAGDTERRDLQLQHAVRCATTPEQADVGPDSNLGTQDGGDADTNYCDRCVLETSEPCGAACSKTTSSEQTFNITNAHLKPIYNINTNRNSDSAGAASTGGGGQEGTGGRSADCTGEPEDASSPLQLEPSGLGVDAAETGGKGGCCARRSRVILLRGVHGLDGAAGCRATR